MRITSLRATGWRNLAPLELTLDPEVRLTVLHGDNGHGKTNVIEALYFLATLRSFRTSHAADLVRVGESAARVVATVERGEVLRQIEVRLTMGAAPPDRDGPEGRPATRSVFVDGKHARSVGAVLGAVSVVLFVPEDLLLPRAAPASRRRFLDMAVFGVEPAYFAEAAAFQRILRSRNALLRQHAGERRALHGAGVPAALLDTYDEQLASAGARVVLRRRQLVKALAPHVQQYFEALHATLPVGLEYLTEAAVAAVEDEVGVAGALLSGLKERRTLDHRRGHTTSGPQSDDLEIRLGGRPARAHASQGQLRSLVLALKLAEMANARARLGDVPVLLLDDVPSELDPERRRYLFETLAALDGQTVLSVADAAVVPPLAQRADFLVRNGVLTAG